jgi:hypothetical protein
VTIIVTLDQAREVLRLAEVSGIESPHIDELRSLIRTIDENLVDADDIEEVRQYIIVTAQRSVNQ